MFLFSFTFPKRRKNNGEGESLTAPPPPLINTMVYLCLVNVQSISLSVDYSACNVKQLTGVPDIFTLSSVQKLLNITFL